MLKRWLEQLCQANARKTLENHTGTIKTEQGTMCGCDVFLLFFYTICKGVPLAKLMILMDFMEKSLGQALHCKFLGMRLQQHFCSRMGKCCSSAAATPFPHGRQNVTLTHTSPWRSESLALPANHKILAQTANSKVKP